VRQLVRKLRLIRDLEKAVTPWLKSIDFSRLIDHLT
jgi:hypothetical protein